LEKINREIPAQVKSEVIDMGAMICS
jgi:hypothetical protein